MGNENVEAKPDTLAKKLKLKDHIVNGSNVLGYMMTVVVAASFFFLVWDGVKQLHELNEHFRAMRKQVENMRSREPARSYPIRPSHEQQLEPAWPNGSGPPDSRRLINTSPSDTELADRYLAK